MAFVLRTRVTTVAGFKAIRRNGTHFILFLGLFLGIAQTSVANPILIDVQSELDANRIVWTAQGLTDYNYRFQRSCFCIPSFAAPGIVSVRNGSIVSVVSAIDGLPLDPANYPTIEELFDEIQSAIDFPAANISLTYDAQVGFASSISIDYILQVADEEKFYTASEFVPIPEPSTLTLLSLGLTALAMRRSIK